MRVRILYVLLNVQLLIYKSGDYIYIYIYIFGAIAPSGPWLPHSRGF